MRVMKTAALIWLLAVAGCISFSPYEAAVIWLDSIQGQNAPAVRDQEVEGKTLVMGKRAVWFLGEENVIAFVGLVAARKETGAWPEVKEIVLKERTWTVRRAGECLALHTTDQTLKARAHTIMAPDGYLAVDEDFARTLEEFESVFPGKRSSGLPVVPITSGPRK